MSTGLSYEPRAEPATRRAAAKNCYTLFGEAWHAVRILALEVYTHWFGRLGTPSPLLLSLYAIEGVPE